ncbi:Oligopeptide-binding protein OppA [bioreactor metagenome]|uniref:Oligopeptide-binding protein OppA n=2 Tax=root TaxID=1 RepID=A0A645FT03_9ZZZZ
MRGSDERTKQEAEWYQQVFREKIGFNLKIEMMEWNVAYDKVDKGEFQLFNNGWNADYNDPSTFLDCYAEGGYYADGFNDAEYNELIKKARLSTNNDERTQLFKRAEEILIKDKCVIIPLYSAIDLYYTRNFIKGLVQPSLGDPDYKGVYTLGRGTK